VAFSAIMGLLIPGAMGVVGVVCNCHGAKRNNEIDAYHAFMKWRRASTVAEGKVLQILQRCASPRF
jgi:hypothetical protein